jgi:hypothetical protein
MKAIMALVGVAMLAACSAGGGVAVDPRVVPVASCDALSDAVTRVQNKRDTSGITPAEQAVLTEAVNGPVTACASDLKPDPNVVALYVARLNDISPPLDGVFN